MKLAITLLCLIVSVIACKKNNPSKVVKPRAFNMGFSSANFGTEEEEQIQTYDTIQAYGDIYLEEITSPIPWGPLVSNSPLPESFLDEINTKVDHKNGDKLVLALNLLNDDRSNIRSDYAGNYPAFFALNDQIMVDAYYSYASYLIYKFDPEYIILSMESNELLIKNPPIWFQYKALVAAVRNKIKYEFPDLKFSQSISLHKWEIADVTDFSAYNAEIQGLFNGYDFAAITYYPYFNDQHDRKSFQKSFDFLHDHVNIPIAIVKTGHLANDIKDSSIKNTESDEKEQEEYLSTLLINAHNHEYEFVIWSNHQDYDLYWESLPDWAQSAAKTYRDTGLKNEAGTPRKAFETWNDIFEAF